MARKGQATSELPEWLSAFVSATQSQIEASRAQAERSERNFTALLAKLDQQEERHKDTTAALQQQLAQATNATPASGPPSAPPSRPPSAPPPAKLTPDLSLREFRAWRATWTDFFELSDGQRLSPDRQLALFRTCLSSEMRAALGHTIPTKTTLNEQLDEIAEHFRRQRNVALYRVQFEQRQQQAGESFDNFYVAIRELATDAELCGTCLETRLTTRIMSGVRSEEVRKKLLALTPFPQLEAVVALCRSEESACNTEADLSSKPALNAAVRSPALCRYCGGRPHRSRLDCPAYGKTCSLCNRRHHFPQVCESRDKPLPTRTTPAAAARHACATAKANALDLDPANANLAPSLRTALHKRWRTLAWIACGHSGHWRGSNGDRPSTVLGPRSLSSRPSTSAARRGRRRQWGDVALPWHVSAADTFGSTQHRRPCSRLRLRRWHPLGLVCCPRLGSYPSQLSGATPALRRPGCCPTVLELVTSGLGLALAPWQDPRHPRRVVTSSR